MRKKGAVPIPYIIALLLGIAVVSILGYWFFVLGGQWGMEVTLQRCNTRAMTYCTTWRTAAYGYDKNEEGSGTGKPNIVGWFFDKSTVHANCVVQYPTSMPEGSNALEDSGDTSESTAVNNIEKCNSILAQA